MKYYCEACERLVPPAAFRVEEGLLVLKCSRCKVETRGGAEQSEAPGAAAGSKPTTQGPVIMLATEEAEPDPTEFEPTRRMSVPASVLDAIDSVSKESRGKGKKEAPAPVPAPAKTPAPLPEPVAAKALAPEPLTKSPSSKLPMSEAAASNMVVLRLADVQARMAPEPAPAAPQAVPSRPSVAQLRVVESVSSGSEDPFMPPPGYCPKCIGPRKEGPVVCPYCGLEYGRFRIEEHRPSPVLSSTWLGVLELWESKGAHDKVLALASEKGELAALGRLYRIRLARSPEDAQAKRGREEVVRLASAGSGLMPSAPPDKRVKTRAAVLGFVFFVLVVAAMFIAYQAKQMLLGP